MTFRNEQPDAGRDEPRPHCDYWEIHGPTKLLLSSADRGWSGLSAEIRTHDTSVIPWRSTPSDVEICVDLHGNGSPVTRRANGIADRTLSRRDTVWFSPAGWREGTVDIGGNLPGIAHVYLPPSQFAPVKLGNNVDASMLGSLRYDTAFEDPLLGEMTRVIAEELKAETSAGKLLVESLASSMAARLVQKYISAQPTRGREGRTAQGLDRRRLFRVLDYIEANLEGDLTLDRMASIASLSRYHFARAFRKAVGQPPHRYVSARRLERAKALLIQADRPLVDIALALGFSSQANFTRAFRQATGLPPGEYRHERGSRPFVSLPHLEQAIPLLA